MWRVREKGGGRERRETTQGATSHAHHRHNRHRHTQRHRDTQRHTETRRERERERHTERLTETEYSQDGETSLQCLSQSKHQSQPAPRRQRRKQQYVTVYLHDFDTIAIQGFTVDEEAQTDVHSPIALQIRPRGCSPKVFSGPPTLTQPRHASQPRHNEPKRTSSSAQAAALHRKPDHRVRKTDPQEKINSMRLSTFRCTTVSRKRG